MFANKLPKMFLIDRHIDVTKMMVVQMEEMRLAKKYNVRTMLSIFCSIIFNKAFAYDFQKRDGSKFCFFYGWWFFRKDHFTTFIDFSNKFDECDVLHSQQVVSRHNIFIAFLRFIYMCFLSLIWINQLFFSKHSFKESLTYLPFLATCIELKRIVKKYPLNNYRFFVTYYDLAPDQNYFIQKCKSIGVATMTLQHGTFSRKKNVKTVVDSGIEFSGSLSDYFLAWNEYTKDEALKVGMNSKKIKVLGIPKYCSVKDCKTPPNNCNKVFGVILNNGNLDFYNKKMIECANEIYAKTGYRYVLRYHPWQKGNEYTGYLGDGFLHNTDNTKPITDYLKEVDFSIVSNSSVFVELLFLRHRVFRMSISEDDMYSTIKENSFSTPGELVEVLKNPINKENYDYLFKYLCNGYNSCENYKRFFKEMSHDDYGGSDSE